MDMDIPEPDELEWLESNSCFPEDDLDLEPPDLYPPELEEEEDEHKKQIPQPQSPPKSPQRTEPQIDGQKRHRTDGPDVADAVPSEEKRSRTEDDASRERDEEWLRYSPPPLQQESVDVVEEKIVSRYASEIDGDFFPVTAPSGGERVYSKICMFEEEKKSKKLDMRGQSNGLILEPINALLQKVEQEAFTKALQASTVGHSEAVLPEEPAMHKQLWVDKYAPNSFTDLLSDEQTNREVLLWLKQWDSCVFGSEIRSTSEDVFSALRRHSSVSQHQKVSDTNFARKRTGSRWHSEKFRDSDGLTSESSNAKGIHEFSNKKSRPIGPPEQKILLLCGPPGLGKTTLAHVAAKHCGYRVVEVNASDDRSSSSIESKILDVVQMNSVTPDSRPKCLVIDEIDGALGDGKGAVEVILKMVSADRKSDGKENAAREEQSGSKSSKKGKKTASLSRPVICICNDLYAPALRPLRQVAKVHIFVQPTVSRVVSRLKYICNKEGMKTSSIALTALSEYTECDIRSCLNTLQFLDKKKEILNVSEISSQVVGRKDMSRSVFDIWKEIFQKRKVKRERKSNNNSSSMSNDFEFLYSLVNYRGDYDLIFNGIHENMLQLNYHDPVMQKTVRCLHSLGVSDLMHQYIMRTQQMSLLVYQPPIAITVHRLVSQVQKPNIEWPKSQQRYRTTLMDKMEILRSWHYKILPHIGRHLSTKSFVEDSVSPLLHILSPPALRPVALHLLSDKQKGDLSQLISIMVSYSVTYKKMKLDPLPGSTRQEAALEASTLCFDPPISEFINFKGYNSGHHVLALAMKQVLVHEVEKQRILLVGIGKSQHLLDGQNKVNQNMIEEVQLEPKRAESCRTNHSAVRTQTKDNAMKILNPSSSKISATSSSTTVTANVKLQASVDVKPKKPSSASFNFDRWKLGSKGSQSSNSAPLKSVTLERDSRPLLFKFNEGYTNAVKRPVRMREFLQ